MHTSNVRRALAAVLFALPFLGGCASSKLSMANASSRSGTIQVIGMAPGGGVLADAVGIELANRGFRVIDSSSFNGMMARLNLNEVQIEQEQGLGKLREAGVEAVLVVRGVAGPDGSPDSASIRVNDTKTGAVVAGLTWQNGWGGMRGSIADRVQRKGLSDAAVEIADALTPRLR